MLRSNGLAGPNSFAVLFDRFGIRIGHTYSDEIVFHPGGPLPLDVVATAVAERRFGSKTQALLEEVIPFPEQFERAVAGAPEGGVFYGFASVNQQWNYGVARRLTTASWTSFYMLPEAPLQARIGELVGRKAVFAGLVMVFALLAGVLVALDIGRPIRRLTEATLRLAAGDGDARVGDVGRDELGRLGETFNEMADRIAAQGNALREYNEELEERVRWRTAELAASESRKAAVLDSAFDAIVWMDHGGELVEFNPAAEKLFGYRRAAVIGKPMVSLLVPPSLRDDHLRGFERHLRTGEGPVIGRVVELSAMRADGSEFPAELAINRVVDQAPALFTAFIRDVTERKQTREKLEQMLTQVRTLNTDLEARVESRTAALSAALKEREVLLQEVHHRVKNNLQVISSLINMQMRQMGEGSSRSALHDCKARVETIALIHEKLYQAKDYASVPFSEYARGLAANIFHATGISPAGVALQVDIETVRLAVDKAIPCGLILNELITNALKHAFPSDRRGSVRVELHQKGGEVLLAVTDDGIGLPSDFSPARSKSLGMQLVATLVKQLDARLEIVKNGGTAFKITLALGEE